MMNEDQIRKLVRDEMTKNKVVQPHKHDGVTNLLIDQQTLGFVPIPQKRTPVTFNYNSTSNGVESNVVEEQAYGFGSPNKLAPFTITAGPVEHQQQYVANTNVLINPIPIVVGNGVGTQSAFEGGAAPDGTQVAFLTGATATSFLYIKFGDSWYGVNLAATPVAVLP